MQGRDELTEYVGRLYTTLTVRAKDLGVRTKHDKKWPQSSAVLSRYLRHRPEALAAIGLYVKEWKGDSKGMKVTLARILPTSERMPEHASRDASPDKRCDSNNLRTSDASKQKEEKLAQLRMLKGKE